MTIKIDDKEFPMPMHNQRLKHALETQKSIQWKNKFRKLEVNEQSIWKMKKV